MYTFPLSTPCDAMLATLVYATHWLSMHLYTLAYMFMHESCLLVCRPSFNAMKLWTSDPNPHLSSRGHHIFVCFLAGLPFCLFACFLISLLVMPIMLICFMPFHMLFASFPSIACLLVSCLCLCMYTHGAWTHGARARSPRRKRKGRGCKHVDISQVAMFSSFRGSNLSHLVMYSFKIPSFLLPFSLRWVVLGISCHVPFVLISRVWRPLFTFLHLYFGPRSRDAGIFFPILCAHIVHDVCIYILARPFRCDCHSPCH